MRTSSPATIRQGARGGSFTCIGTIPPLAAFQARRNERNLDPSVLPVPVRPTTCPLERNLAEEPSAAGFAAASAVPRSRDFQVGCKVFRARAFLFLPLQFPRGRC